MSSNTVNFSDTVHYPNSPVKNFIEENGSIFEGRRWKVVSKDDRGIHVTAASKEKGEGSFLKTAAKVIGFAMLIIPAFKGIMLLAKALLRAGQKFHVTSKPIPTPPEKTDPEKPVDQPFEYQTYMGKEKLSPETKEKLKEMSIQLGLVDKKFRKTVMTVLKFRRNRHEGTKYINEFYKAYQISKKDTHGKLAFEALVKKENQKRMHLIRFQTLTKDILDKIDDATEKEAFLAKVGTFKKESPELLQYLVDTNQELNAAKELKGYQKLMKATMKTHDLVNVPGDGHCHFYSISMAMNPEALQNFMDWNGKNKTGQLFFKEMLKLRGTLVQFMFANKSKILANPGIPIDEQNFHLKTVNMGDSSSSVSGAAWGEVWTAQLIACAIKQPVHVIFNGSSHISRCEVDLDGNKLEGEPIKIWFDGGGHYQSFIKKG